MHQFEVSDHARVRQQERSIAWDWVWATLVAPDRVEAPGLWHYQRFIPSTRKRLTIVVNPAMRTPRLVTMYWTRQRRPAGGQR